MGKLYLLIFLSEFFNLDVNGQVWVRTYGNGLNANVYDVTESYDRGFIFAAQINYGAYLWIFKTDINGEILWDKRIGTGQESSFFSPMNIEQTTDNGYIICGSSTKYGSYDAYLIKINSCAEIEWCKVLETPTNFDEGFRIKQTQDGDFIMLGAYFVTEPYSNISLFKFNRSGSLIWHQFYPIENMDYNDQPYDLLADDDGYIIVTDRYFPDPGTTSPGILRHHFIKTDTAGIQNWELVYGANDYYYGSPWAANKSTSGNYYAAGNHFYSNGTGSPAFVKVLHNGSQSYYKDIMPNATWGGLSSIDFLQDSLLVMVGGWYSDINTKHDAFFKTDTLGNLRTLKEIEWTTNSYEAAYKTIDDKFIAVGNDASSATWKIVAVKVNSNLDYDSIYTQPFTYDSLCPHSIVSDTIDPDCENEYVDIEEPFTSPETTKLSVFPNPASDKVTIEMPKYLVLNNTTSKIPSTTIYHQWKSVKLEIYDITGKKVMEREINKSDTILDLDVSEWGKGMYAFRLVYQKQEVGNAMVVVQ
ncbi:MAG: T9SS type A sorting domain-containing protein [Bacteroidales bacterium]